VTGWCAAAALAIPMLFAQLPPGGAAPTAGGASPAAGTTSEIQGEFSVLAATFPRRDVAELRPRASVTATATLARRVDARFEGFVEALVADRGGRVTSAIARVREGWLQVGGDRADLRVGFGRLVWGKLDEIQPSDVINPIEAARFLLRGRAEARRPVALIRARLFASERFALEGVAAPYFRRGVFDELDEETSPFNLVNDTLLPAGVSAASVPIVPDMPRGVDRLSGGARATSTIGRVDVSASWYRGRDGFGIVSFEPGAAPEPGGVSPPAPTALVVGRLVERFPRFTMVAGDVETVAGEWAIRGEGAIFVDRTFAASSRPGTVGGRSLDAGVGTDRRAGSLRVFGSVVVHRQWSAEDAGIARTDVNLVGSVERAFGRDRWLARVFGVGNPADASGFLRGLVTWRVRDDMALEASAGAFLGTGADTISRFSGRDFVMVAARWGTGLFSTVSASKVPGVATRMTTGGAAAGR
jgi:hypothetical protein